MLLAHISPIAWSNVILYGEYKLNKDMVYNYLIIVLWTLYGRIGAVPLFDQLIHSVLLYFLSKYHELGRNKYFRCKEYKMKRIAWTSQAKLQT